MESLNHELFEFAQFKSIPRLSREMVISEKLDGTNAQVVVFPVSQLVETFTPPPHKVIGDMAIAAGSKNRWLSPEEDNFGFARWVYAHAEELIEGIGEGRHYGEWWGSGIQRGYGLKEKFFSLFNVNKWSQVELPTNVNTVPVLYEGPFCTEKVDEVLKTLHDTGSVAVPGFMNPEGVVVFHKHSSSLFKKTLDKNDQHKWQDG